MGKILVHSFLALVRSMFHALQARDSSDHTSHRAKALVDLVFGHFGFEFEYAEMSDHGIGSG
jgi:hypothetical protein